MLNALALLAGLLAIAGVALYLGRGWLKLERQDRAPDPFGDVDLDDPADLIRHGPTAHLEREDAAWRAERRRDGRTDAEIEAELDERTVVVWF